MKLASTGQRFRLYPVLILLILSSFPWLFSIYQSAPSPGWLDPYFYTGHFLNKELAVKQLDYRAYYHARISWILVGDTVFTILNHDIAGIALRLLLSFAVSSGFYKILRLLQSDRKYIFPIIVLASLPTWHPDFGMTIFWDYPDGPAICYATWGFFFLLNHRMKDFYRFFLAAVFFVLAGCANLIVGLVIASGLIAYAVVYRPDPRRYFASLFAGFLFANGLLLILGRIVYGNALTYLYQWRQVRRVITDVKYLADMWGHGFDFLIYHNRYITFAAIVAISSVVLVRYKTKLSANLKFLQWMYFLFVLSLLFHAVADLVFQKATLRVYYHVSYLLLPMHLLLAGLILELFSIHTGKWRKSTLLWLGIAVASGTILIASKFVLSFFQISSVTNWILIGLYLSICFSLLFVPWRLRRLTIAMLFFLPAMFSLFHQSRSGSPLVVEYSIFNERNSACMKTILQVSEVLYFLDMKEKLSFVYSEEEEALHLFDSIASTFAVWNFPTGIFKDFLEKPNNYLMKKYTNGAVIHMATHVEELARQIREFETRGFRPQNVAGFQLRWENKTIWVHITRYKITKNLSVSSSSK